MRGLYSSVAVLPFALFTLATHAQSVDTSVLGTVTDPSGSVISGAVVTVHSDSTGAEKSVTTGTSGEFTV